MKYRLLFFLSIGLLVTQILIPRLSYVLIPSLVVMLLIRNSRSLVSYLRFLIPSSLFILILYTLLGMPREGVKTVLLLFSTSLTLQFYLSFFRDLSLYDLLLRTGFPRKTAFILYGAVNYAFFIKPVILEIQDAQRLRGIEIPKGVRGLFSFHILLIPLMVRLLKGADHLAESLTLRSYEDLR